MAAKKKTAKTPLEMAQQGDIEGLWELADCDPSGDADGEAYKWLYAAEDFGHDAADRIGDVLELTSLRYDDDGYIQAFAHWELAQAYLFGADGFPNDLKLAKKQLEYATDVLGSDALHDGKQILKKLKGEAAALLKKYL